MYFSPAATIVTIFLFVLIVLDTLLYFKVKKRIGFDMYRLLNNLARKVLIAYLFALTMHWHYQEPILKVVYLFSILLLAIETTHVLTTQSRQFNKYYWRDNILNMLIFLVFFRTYIF
ncbi:hypothetical protein JCM21142_134750 [Saccharicrinis fermentans DSM 9555 = JCM 21142]|uniref:DUF4181 domain-containing protein n=1 Tax=Saccharicrinis fermentans DSM 9555 = JCM 21142 TaxID=869213 RepID=W7YU51_9BACT|nr:hypothetical protein JCM21142_134750 [Saccharicrinis fermentans DSM 9555 = JCM 21142]